MVLKNKPEVEKSTCHAILLHITFWQKAKFLQAWWVKNIVV